jgi:hypothetical protein
VAAIDKKVAVVAAAIGKTDEGAAAPKLDAEIAHSNAAA